MTHPSWLTPGAKVRLDDDPRLYYVVRTLHSRRFGSGVGVHLQRDAAPLLRFPKWVDAGWVRCATNDKPPAPP